MTRHIARYVIAGIVLSSLPLFCAGRNQRPSSQFQCSP